MENHNNFECTICLDVIENDKLLTLIGCKHIFHYSCINTWYMKSNTCPICRQNIKDMFRIMFRPNINRFYNKYHNYIIELKENKILLYKLKKHKKNKVISNLDELSNNNLCNLSSKETLGEIYLSILYQDISIMSMENKCLTFRSLALPKDKNKYGNVAERAPSKSIYIYFNKKIDTERCFEIIKLRHQYFRLLT